MFILKIIVRIDTFPLHQLTTYEEVTALDEVAKDVAISNQWQPTHITFRCSSLHTSRLTLQDQADGVFERVSSWQLDVDSFKQSSIPKN